MLLYVLLAESLRLAWNLGLPDLMVLGLLVLATAPCSSVGLKGLPDPEMTHPLFLCSQTQDHIDLVWLELREARGLFWFISPSVPVGPLRRRHRPEEG